MQSFAGKLVSLVLVWTALVLVMSPAQAYPTVSQTLRSL